MSDGPIKPSDITEEMLRGKNAWSWLGADFFATVLNAAIESGIVSPPCHIGADELKADELKAAIDAKEKAEAEVAAWKEAANHLYPDAGSICSPDDLRSRITDLKGSIDNLHVRVNELKAEIAEVPPLDKRRVLATVAEMAYKAADFDFAKAVCLQMNVAEWKESKPYPLKD